MLSQAVLLLEQVTGDSEASAAEVRVKSVKIKSDMTLCNSAIANSTFYVILHAKQGDKNYSEWTLENHFKRYFELLVCV